METELGEIILYRSEDGQTILAVHLREETVWLTQAQMQKLVGRELSVITKYINNVLERVSWTIIKYVQNLHILRLTVKRIRLSIITLTS